MILSKQTYKKHGFLNSVTLKYIAIITMLTDHLFYLYEADWFRIIGRMAFPVFAFQVAEGYKHSRNKNKYLGRLFLLALLSEIPYDLMCFNSAFYPQNQNVIITFIFAFFIIQAIESLFNKPDNKHFLFSCFTLIVIPVLVFTINPDYSIFGTLLTVSFYFSGKVKFKNTLCLLSLITFNLCMMPFLTSYIQWFSLLAIIPISLYNGQKGKRNKIFAFFSYSFYPLHMFVIYLITLII